MRIRWSHSCPSLLIQRGILRKSFPLHSGRFVRTFSIFVTTAKSSSELGYDSIQDAFHTFFTQIETFDFGDLGSSEAKTIVEPENFPVAGGEVNPQYAVNLFDQQPAFDAVCI